MLCCLVDPGNCYVLIPASKQNRTSLLGRRGYAIGKEVARYRRHKYVHSFFIPALIFVHVVRQKDCGINGIYWLRHGSMESDEWLTSKSRVQSKNVNNVLGSILLL